MSNLAKELQEKLGEHNPNEVDELILDDLFENIDSFSDSNKADLEKYSNLLHLSLNGFGLTNLKNFPKIPTLQILEIRQNKLDGSDLSTIKELYPELYKLKLGENKISSLDNLKALSGSNVRKLELSSNPAATGEYRSTLFGLLSGLETVDRNTKEGEEIDSTIYEDEEGEGEEFEDEGDFDDEEGEDDEFDDEEGEDFEDEDEAEE